MRSVYLSGVLAFAFVLTPVFAFAQTDEDSTVEDELRARVAQLEEQLETALSEKEAWKQRAESMMKQQQSQAQASIKAKSESNLQVLQEKRLERLLSVGMTGEDVRALQERLAQEPGVYPEGLITGYYGPLTEAALARLKARHNMSEEARVFGPQTLAFLNQWLRGEGVKDLPAPGKMISAQQRAQAQMPAHVQELLEKIRAGKRGEELRGTVKPEDDDEEEEEEVEDEEDEE